MASADFDDRLIRLVLKHEALTRGAQFRITPQGLVTATPAPRRRLPWLGRALALALAAVALKALLVALVGEDAYATGLAALRASGPPGGLAAWLLQGEPVTDALAALAG